MAQAQQSETADQTRLEELAAYLSDSGTAAEIQDHDQLCRDYFRHVDVDFVLDRDVDVLGLLMESHLTLGQQRKADESCVKVWTPTVDEDGWKTPGEATVIQIVTTDLPFLVDSVQMEILRQGWTLRELLHPQLMVRRDGGKLVGIGGGSGNSAANAEVAESWMCIEAVPAPGKQPEQDTMEKLETGVRSVLADVAVVVADWEPLRANALQASDDIASSETPHTEAQRQTAVELMRWVAANNFTLLGYREYKLVRGDGTREYEPVPGTGLGLLRSEEASKGRFGANPPTTTLPQLVLVTKDNQISTVHRPTYLDYLGVRNFDEQGRVIGERRFLGLFAASAYSESVSRIPVLRAKAGEIMRIIGYSPESHGGKAALAVLNNYPRDELFQTQAEELAPIIERIANLRERRQVRVFERRDPYGRYLSALVYFPRDRYTTQVRFTMQEILLKALGGESVEYEARVGESVLARLHFIVRMPSGRRLGGIDVAALEEELSLATRTWNDDLYDAVAASDTEVRRDEVSEVFPAGFKEDFSPRQAMLDVDKLSRLDERHDMSMVIYRPERADDEADLRLKIFCFEALPLSRVLPHLAMLGVDVIDERPYQVTLPNGKPAFVLDFGLLLRGGEAEIETTWTTEGRTRFTEAFAASYARRAESDALNALVMSAGLSWREVSWLRAISRYLQQAGITFSQTYIAGALVANQEIATSLVELFRHRFSPASELDHDERQAGSEEREQAVIDSLEAVESLDHDRILRYFITVIKAIIRTNAFQPDAQALALKMLPSEIPDLPQPRPEFEIFVYSPRLEGVHLRFGPVARGGLRWSDRAEDFRTEVLGLVKAQMVKNSVIVPVGAKGGFYCKLPVSAADRAEEGKACYKIFIASLLSVTDNIVDGEIVPPGAVVRWDADDPYLVVAADKGTATFSDLANAISVDAGFWLGDAFASGGSVGYDHKAMGITARGAWESVKRHFRELGITSEFTAVGIGDMAGDVFGNGMLLSRDLKLLAAFNHRHIFLDPNPDPEASFVERQRLFDKPRSSWSDYDAELISAGGGVYEKAAKSIPISPEVREALSIPGDEKSMQPNALIRHILCAKVDLLWNGGIGTYVKGESESNADVGDKANDHVRINGSELRARSVGEGGNLGFTQLGRIEFARNGGLINADFIDNSAGVDTSDYEVNIKILLQPEVADGHLSQEDRVELLASMTDDVAHLVLRHNDDQNTTLANACAQASALALVHEEWMTRLEELDLLNREIEYLPDSEAMHERIADGRGLTNPELATLLSYTKIWLNDVILASDLPEDEFVQQRLVDYFPPALREKYRQQMQEHRLRREIITTVAINRFVNSAGITATYRLCSESGTKPEDVLRAQLASRSIFNAAGYEAQLRELDSRIDAARMTRFRLDLRTLVERGTRWVLNNRRAPIDIAAVSAELAEPVQRFHEALPEVLGTRELQMLQERRDSLLEQGFTSELSIAGAGMPFAHAAMTLAQVASRFDRDIVEVAKAHFSMTERLGLDEFRRSVLNLSRRDRWQDLARAALRDDLQSVTAQITGQVLDTGESDPLKAVEAWLAERPSAHDTAEALKTTFGGEPDLARLSVGLRAIRALAESS